MRQPCSRATSHASSLSGATTFRFHQRLAFNRDCSLELGRMFTSPLRHSGVSSRIYHKITPDGPGQLLNLCRNTTGFSSATRKIHAVHHKSLLSSTSRRTFATWSGVSSRRLEAQSRTSLISSSFTSPPSSSHRRGEVNSHQHSTLSHSNSNSNLIHEIRSDIMATTKPPSQKILVLGAGNFGSCLADHLGVLVSEKLIQISSSDIHN